MGNGAGKATSEFDIADAFWIRQVVPLSPSSNEIDHYPSSHPNKPSHVRNKHIDAKEKIFPPCFKIDIKFLCTIRFKHIINL